MSIDKGRISSRRLMLTAICFIKASTLLTAFLTSVAMQDSWLVVLVATVLCLPLIWLYSALMLAFPDLNLIQMLEKVFGKVAGKALGAMYVWFFITLSSLNLLDLGDLTKLSIMEETPTVVLMAICALVAVYTVRGGIRAVTWYSALFIVISYGILILSVLLVTSLMRAENFLPMLHLPPIRYLQGEHIVMTIPMGELVVLLMLTPNVNLSRRTLAKQLCLGLLLGGLGFMLVVFRDTAVLGNLLHVFDMPSLVTLRMVRLGDAVSRVETLYVISFVLLLYFKITLLFYASVMAIAQLFGTKRFRNLALAAGAFMVAYGSTLYANPLEHAASGREITPILWTPFEILIPAILLIVAKLRKLPAKAEG